MNELIKILSDIRPEIDFTVPHRLVDDKILDSIDVVTLVGDISDAYGIEVPIEEIIPENFNSVGAIYKMIERLRG